MLNRRETQRRRTYLGATISFDADFPIVDCLVRDMSQNGARLVLAGTAILPNRFGLLMRKQRITLRAEMMWRDADQVGVAFLD